MRKMNDGSQQTVCTTRHSVNASDRSSTIATTAAAEEIDKSLSQFTSMVTQQHAESTAKAAGARSCWRPTELKTALDADQSRDGAAEKEETVEVVVLDLTGTAKRR